MKNRKQKKNNNSSQTGLRLMIALGALASTVSGWALLSRQEEQAANLQNTKGLPDPETVEVTVQLPALPTLVPENGVDPDDLPEQPSPTQPNMTLRVVNNPRSAPSSSSNPVARTRSS